MKIEITADEHRQLLTALDSHIEKAQRAANTEKEADVKALRETAVQKYKNLQNKIASQEVLK